MYVVRISDDPHRFDAGAELLHENGRTLVVEHARLHRDRFLVKFEGVGSREEAEAIRGTLFIPAGAARELADGEFWEHDVIGCEVVLSDGTSLGTVAAVVPGPAQDLLEVDTRKGPRLVPFVGDLVERVDPSARRVVVDPPEGLLD